jgi:hypothetical protein
MIVGITNQGGVAAGHKSMQECINGQTQTYSAKFAVCRRSPRR